MKDCCQIVNHVFPCSAVRWTVSTLGFQLLAVKSTFVACFVLCVATS